MQPMPLPCDVFAGRYVPLAALSAAKVGAPAHDVDAAKTSQGRGIGCMMPPVPGAD